MAEDRATLLAEAYKRGILPPEQKAAYEEATKRGILKSGGVEVPAADDSFKSWADYWERGALPSIVREPLRAMERLGKDIVGKGGRSFEDPAVSEDALTAIPAVMGSPLSPKSVASGSGKGLAAISAAKEGPTAQQTLREAKVLMTPGQAMGGIARRAEEAFKSFPILGSFIRKAEGQSLESFNRAVIDQALAPISRKLPKDTELGHDAIAYADRQFDEAYARIKGEITFRADDQFRSDMDEIRVLVTELPPAMQEQFGSIVKNRVIDRMRGQTPETAATGEAFKTIESDLTRLSSQYRGSPDPAQRELAQRLSEVKLAMRSSLSRSNPEHAEALQAINEGYALMVRAEGAAARRPTSAGIFTPGDLLQTIKAADRSVRKRDFARGDALLQNFAEAGHEVLAKKLPDSGTPERLMWDIGGAATGAFDPRIPAALGAASLPYTGPGMRAFNYLSGPPATIPRPPAPLTGPATSILTEPPSQEGRQ